MSDKPTLVGRSSSHYSRLARLFLLELGVDHEFRPVRDLTVLDRAVYADNPALKIPILVDERGPLFGSENVAREAVRRAGRRAAVTLSGDVDDRALANVDELTRHVMASEVSVVMAKLEGRAAPPKVAASLAHSLAHLDAHVDAALAALPPERALSYVEVALFCVLRHLTFREVADVSPYARLVAFADRFGERPGARATEYRFDFP